MPSAEPEAGPEAGPSPARGTGPAEQAGPPLTVTIDATAIPAEMGGVGRYLAGLLGALVERDDVQPIVLAGRGDGRRWDGVRVLERAPARRAARLAWEQTGLPVELSRLDPSVHHGPHYTLPQATRVPRVVTIHDLTFFTHPEWHVRSKLLLFRTAIRRAAHAADALVCVSRATAERLADLHPRGRVVVAPHGVDLDRFRADAGADDTAVREGLGVRGPYVAFLGKVEPRKDVPTLVRAWDRVAGNRPDLQLVIAGSPGWAEDQLTAAIGAARHRDRILRLGYVEESAVPALLRGAAAVAYPSLEEGFGLPVLEALACGAPTITTEGTAMAEAADGAAVLVRAGDAWPLTDALDAVVEAGAPAGLRVRGLEVARASTWAASAGRHVEAYRAAANR